ncbi:MAG TPA: S1C family serine protease [Bacilli bacterium]|nr:S1C family serine protease [Bacilli bacterium]
MGFYDDFEGKPAKKSGGGNVKSWIAVALVSALIGSGSTIALVPQLIKNNVLSVSENATNTNTTQQGTSEAKETYNVNINSGVVEAVNKVKPAVVGVRNMQNRTDFFGRSVGEQEAGTGSGVVFSDKGYIVTNNHVVAGADEVMITFEDGHNVKAEVVGTDYITDLAVLKVDPKEVKDIKPVAFGNSDALNIGEPAIAIGNPLGMRFAQTVTVGVISATKRDMPIRDANGQEVYSQNVLQTDAAINPGNSGGALINMKGELVGINSAKIATEGVEGIGFAIPINEAQPIVEQLMDKGKVDRPGIGIGGIAMSQLYLRDRPQVPVENGIVVMEMQDNAKKAGLEKYDVITAVDGQKVEDLVDLRKVLFQKKPGDEITLEVYRGKEKKEIKLQLVKIDV